MYTHHETSFTRGKRFILPLFLALPLVFYLLPVINAGEPIVINDVGKYLNISITIHNQSEVELYCDLLNSTINTHEIDRKLITPIKDSITINSVAYIALSKDLSTSGKYIYQCSIDNNISEALELSFNIDDDNTINNIDKSITKYIVIGILILLTILFTIGIIIIVGKY